MSEIYHQGLSFIFEGTTEKVFYLHLLEYLCSINQGFSLNRIETNPDEIFYELISNSGKSIIKMKTVGGIYQVPNYLSWFNNYCKRPFTKLKWTVFLCYDTDSYKDNITKFQEGDWKALRKSIGKDIVIDLAAKADIEDIFLVDMTSILGYLGLPLATPMPNGSKGKTRLKRLFNSAGCAYQEGERAEPLIKALNMDFLLHNAPVPLGKIEDIGFK